MKLTMGFRNEIRNSDSRRRIESVLRRIDREWPDDLQRLRSRVQSFIPWPSSPWDAEEWSVPTAPELYSPNHFTEPGFVSLREPVSIATIVHALGDAAATQIDMDSQNTVGDEWFGLQAVVCMYGFRWGFEDEIRADRARSAGCRNAWFIPGDPIEIQEEFGELRVAYHYRIDSHHHFQLLREIEFHVQEEHESDARQLP